MTKSARRNQTNVRYENQRLADGFAWLTAIMNVIMGAGLSLFLIWGLKCADFYVLLQVERKSNSVCKKSETSLSSPTSTTVRRR